MPEQPNRRSYLADAIEQLGEPVTTEAAVQLLDGSPFASGRNTVRKCLRGLARTGRLVVGQGPEGRTTYFLISAKDATS
ncbi:hypothetical protein ABTX71_12780 [Streptomyces parvulus]|uniref:hypothetical protein n=1 Tax=Streptomyces parvulus TaxID=146923 RepID=UPI003331DFB0